LKLPVRIFQDMRAHLSNAVISNQALSQAEIGNILHLAYMPSHLKKKKVVESLGNLKSIFPT